MELGFQNGFFCSLSFFFLSSQQVHTPRCAYLLPWLLVLFTVCSKHSTEGQIQQTIQIYTNSENNIIQIHIIKYTNQTVTMPGDSRMHMCVIVKIVTSTDHFDLLNNLHRLWFG